MIDIGNIYQYIEAIVNKNQTGEDIKPDRFNLMMPIVVNSFVEDIYGPLAEYQGAPRTNVSFEVSQAVTDYLQALKILNHRVPLVEGLGNLPSDYLHLTGGYISVQYDDSNQDEFLGNCEVVTGTTKGKKADAPNKTLKYRRIPVKMVVDGQWDNLLTPGLRQATEEYPIGRLAGNKIEIYPQNFDAAHITYLRYPLKCVFGYTVSSSGVVIYDPSASQSIELPEIATDYLTHRFLGRMGIRWRSQFLSGEAAKGGIV